IQNGRDIPCIIITPHTIHGQHTITNTHTHTQPHTHREREKKRQGAQPSDILASRPNSRMQTAAAFWTSGLGESPPTAYLKTGMYLLKASMSTVYGEEESKQDVPGGQ